MKGIPKIGKLSSIQFSLYFQFIKKHMNSIVIYNEINVSKENIKQEQGKAT